MVASALSLTPYTLADTFRVLPLLQHPDRLFVQIDWQTLPSWLLRTDLCGVIGWQAGQPVGLLLADAPRERTAWLRVAALSGDGLHAGGSGYASRLRQVWEALTVRLREAGARRLVVLPVDDWLRRSLEPLGFKAADRILEMRFVQRGSSVIPPPANVRLRLAGANDLDALLAIDAAAFAPLWRMDRTDLGGAIDAGARITLAQAADRVVGYQITYVLDDRVHLARLGVAPDRQGQGIGSALLAGDLAAYQDAATITLYVLGSSHGAQRMYTRMGFVLSGEETPLWALDLD